MRFEIGNWVYEFKRKKVLSESVGRGKYFIFGEQEQISKYFELLTTYVEKEQISSIKKERVSRDIARSRLVVYADDTNKGQVSDLLDSLNIFPSYYKFEKE